MSKDNLLKFLIENYEKEKENLYKKKEIEEKEIDSLYEKKIKELEEGYKAKKINLVNDLKKKLEREYLKKETELELIFQNILKNKLLNLEKKIILSLRDEEYQIIFKKLVEEIPNNIKWRKIKVNPMDLKLAESFFSGAELIEDKEIIGGFIAVSDDEKIKVDNTFEKRIEKARDNITLKILEEIKNYLEKNYVEKN